MELKEFKKLNKVYIVHEDEVKILENMFLLSVGNYDTKLLKYILPGEIGMMPSNMVIENEKNKWLKETGVFIHKIVSRPSSFQLFNANKLKKSYRVIVK